MCCDFCACVLMPTGWNELTHRISHCSPARLQDVGCKRIHSPIVRVCCYYCMSTTVLDSYCNRRCRGLRICVLLHIQTVVTSNHQYERQRFGFTHSGFVWHILYTRTPALHACGPTLIQHLVVVCSVNYARWRGRTFETPLLRIPR
jgi:hypothetical protein